MFCKCKTVFLLLYFKILADFTCKRICAKIQNWLETELKVYVDKNLVS